MSVDLAIVPVAGLGTRLLPATKSQPKEMLPVGRRPVVQYVVEELARAGIKRILFITGYGKSSIEDFFDINHQLINHLRHNGKEDQLAELAFERNEVEYAYTRQREQLGLGHAVLIGEPFSGNQPLCVPWAIRLSSCTRNQKSSSAWWRNTNGPGPILSWHSKSSAIHAKW